MYMLVPFGLAQLDEYPKNYTYTIKEQRATRGTQ